MQISNILSKAKQPELYEKGSAFMWTDGHISQQLLNVHLNPDVDLASRRASTIKKTADWIMDSAKKQKMKVLDLGCGPGLYTEHFAQQGHDVTGVDISKTSIDYARKQAVQKNLNISYICSNYLDLELDEDNFDLVILIYTDLGVLLPNEREQLLKLIHRVLKRGSLFIFDVLNDNDFEKKTMPKNWEVEASGFWRPTPYIVLSESFQYSSEKVILYQHVVIDETDQVEVYRFWTHFFSHFDLGKILFNNSFSTISYHDDILPEGDLWSGDNVTFCVATKD